MWSAESRPFALVVDDQIRVSLVLQAFLEDAGYEVVTARSAQQALKALSTRGKLDVLLADVHLGGADGISLARSILQIQPDAVIVLTSGMPNVNIENLPKGARFLNKPFGEDDLLREIAAAKIMKDTRAP
jgi:CheY-like chemotaxis protein